MFIKFRLLKIRLNLDVYFRPVRLVSAKSYFNRYHGSQIGTGPGITNVESKTDMENGNEFRPKTSMTNWDGKSMKSNPNEDILAPARRFNNIGKVVYVGFYVIFNIIFWSTAISEYVRPAEEYINNDKLTF